MIELRYVPHAAARHLASRKTRVIGLLLNNLHNDFFVPLLNGVEAVVRSKGYNLIVATYHASSRNETPPPIGPHNTDGLLVFSDGLVDEDLANLNASGFPMVLVHRTPPSSFENSQCNRRKCGNYSQISGTPDTGTRQTSHYVSTGSC